MSKEAYPVVPHNRNIAFGCKEYLFQDFLFFANVRLPAHCECTMVFYSLLWYSKVYYSMVQCTMVWCSVLRYSKVYYSAVYCTNMRYSVVCYSTVYFGMVRGLKIIFCMGTSPTQV